MLGGRPRLTHHRWRVGTCSGRSRGRVEHYPEVAAQDGIDVFLGEQPFVEPFDGLFELVELANAG
jgi:hypothetical protein